MKVNLIAVVEDYPNRKRANVYIQEDAKYFVLLTPLNPTIGAQENVEQFSNLTFEEMTVIALPKWKGGQP